MHPENVYKQILAVDEILQCMIEQLGDTVYTAVVVIRAVLLLLALLEGDAESGQVDEVDGALA